jgi:hypothetical protein
MRVTLTDSLIYFREFKANYIPKLPEQLHESELKKFQEELCKRTEGVELHIEALYRKGFALGENLSGLTEYSKDKYYFICLEGIGRHIEECLDQVKAANKLVSMTGERRAMYADMIGGNIRS